MHLHLIPNRNLEHRHPAQTVAYTALKAHLVHPSTTSQKEAEDVIQCDLGFFLSNNTLDARAIDTHFERLGAVEEELVMGKTYGGLTDTLFSSRAPPEVSDRGF